MGRADERAAERRAHGRVDFGGRAWLESEYGLYWAKVRNLSTGGVALSTPGAVNLGTTLNIGFDLPRGGRVRAEAQVVRARGGELALRFVHLSPESLKSLTSFVWSDGSPAG